MLNGLMVFSWLSSLLSPPCTITEDELSALLVESLDDIGKFTSEGFFDIFSKKEVMGSCWLCEAETIFVSNLCAK